MAAAAEASSEHPLARAILAYARSCLRVGSSSLDLQSSLSGALALLNLFMHGTPSKTV